MARGYAQKSNTFRPPAPEVPEILIIVGHLFFPCSRAIQVKRLSA
jgi:hypothetical protein